MPYYPFPKNHLVISAVTFSRVFPGRAINVSQYSGSSKSINLSPSLWSGSIQFAAVEWPRGDANLAEAIAEIELFFVNLSDLSSYTEIPLIPWHENRTVLAADTVVTVTSSSVVAGFDHREITTNIASGLIKGDLYSIAGRVYMAQGDHAANKIVLLPNAGAIADDAPVTFSGVTIRVRLDGSVSPAIALTPNAAGPWNFNWVEKA